MFSVKPDPSPNKNKYKIQDKNGNSQSTNICLVEFEKQIQNTKGNSQSTNMFWVGGLGGLLYFFFFLNNPEWKIAPFQTLPDCYEIIRSVISQKVLVWVLVICYRSFDQQKLRATPNPTMKTGITIEWRNRSTLDQKEVQFGQISIWRNKQDQENRPKLCISNDIWQS